MVAGRISTIASAAQWYRIGPVAIVALRHGGAPLMDIHAIL